MKKVLIVDDEIDMAIAVKESVKRCGFEPVVYNSAVDVLAGVNLTDFSLIITDMKMPHMDGLEFLHKIRSMGVHIPVVVVTGYGTVENAVDAMKLGATDYIMKPFSFEALKNVIDRIMPSNDYGIIAESLIMKKILAVVSEVAGSDITVLLSGESGTGKEVIARFIHKNSSRSQKPFVAINCAAISESLLEAELFGHEKGAFTGASDRRQGKFELADKGTLLLDEVSEMAYSLQAKLLRAIQEKEIDRIGGRSPIPVDVRIISTTNRDLMAEVKAGKFREDLYYRLNVFPIKLPPLRERVEDIVPLAKFFLKKLTQKTGKAFILSKELEESLKAQRWEGNVRELENFIYRIAVISKSELLSAPEAQADVSGAAVNEMAFSGTMEDMKRELIVKTLKDTKGNRTKAAQVLNVSTRTIRNKIKDYGIKDEEIS